MTDTNQPQPWWRDRVLWPIVLLATILRLSLLGHKSLWLDEAATYTLATDSWHAFAREWWAREANATAYYMLEKGWLLFGRSEWMLRFSSAVFGVMGVIWTYVYAKRAFGGRVAWIAAFLLAVNPAHVDHSQEARFYPMAMWLVLCASLLLLRAIEEGGARWWTAYVLVGTLAVYSHVFASLVLVAHAVSLGWVPLEQRRWRPALLAGFCFFLLCAPILFFLARQGHTISTPFIPPVSAKELFRLFQFYSGSGLKFILAIVLWGIGLWQIGKLWRLATKDPFARWRIVMLLSWILVPIALLAAVSLRQPMFGFKYLLFSLPAILVLAATGAAALPRYARWGVLAALSIASCVTVVAGYKKPIEDWRSVSAYVQENFQPGDAIAFSPPYSRNALDYYWDRGGVEGLKFLAPKPLVGNMEADNVAEANPAALLAACKECRRVWLVEYGTDAPPPEAQERMHVMVAAMPAGDQLRLTKDFRNLRLYLYAPQ